MKGQAYHGVDPSVNGSIQSFFLGVDCYLDDDPIFPVLIGGNTMQHLDINTSRAELNGDVYRYLHIGNVEGWEHALRVPCSPPAEWKLVRKDRSYDPIMLSVYMITDDAEHSTKAVDRLVAELNKKEIRKQHAMYPKPKAAAVKKAEDAMTLKEKRKIAAKSKPYKIANLNQDKTILEYNNVIAEWALSPEDVLASLPIEEYHNKDVPIGGTYSDPLAHDRPPLSEGFPLEYWHLVPLSQQRKVKNRWNGYDEDDLVRNIKEIIEMDVCDKRPIQRPYCIAQALAFMPAFFLPKREVKHMRS